MPEAHTQIFRQRSLEHLASPDRIDRLLAVVGPRYWLALLASGVVLALAVAWSVAGRIPETADGIALLARPRQIGAFQSPARGRIEAIDVFVGAVVHSGDPIGRLDQPELTKQIEQEVLRLDQVRERAAKILAMEQELALLDRGLLDEQRRMIETRVEEIERNAAEVRKRSQESIAQQRENLQEARRVSAELLGALRKRLESYQELIETKDISQDLLVEMNTRVLERQLSERQLEVDAQELDLREILAQESYDRQQDVVRDQAIQIQDIQVQLAAIDRRIKARELEDRREIEEIERGIALLRARLETEGRILSMYDGRVIEVTAFAGEQVDLGAHLGRIEIDDPARELMAIAYFRVQDGKQIKAGQRIVVTPSTVERERHGGIVGQVDKVSDYPVSTAAAASQIGDIEIARTLLGGENRIEVTARLQADPDAPSGFAWTSRPGPERVLVTGGTTARVQVTVEQRAPITYVIPYLRSLTGI